MSNRHYQERKCSFNLPNFPTQKIITGDFGCKGNGITLGYYNGSDNFGAAEFYGTRAGTFSGLYGNSVGSPDRTGRVETSAGIGLTTDTTKSGIITDTSGFTSVNVCIKF